MKKKDDNQVFDTSFLNDVKEFDEINTDEVFSFDSNMSIEGDNNQDSIDASENSSSNRYEDISIEDDIITPIEEDPEDLINPIKEQAEKTDDSKTDEGNEKNLNINNLAVDSDFNVSPILEQSLEKENEIQNTDLDKPISLDNIISSTPTFDDSNDIITPIEMPSTAEEKVEESDENNETAFNGMEDAGIFNKTPEIFKASFPSDSDLNDFVSFDNNIEPINSDISDTLEDTNEETGETTEEGFSFEPSENDEIEQTNTEVPEDTGEETGEKTEEGFSFEPSENDEIEQTDTEVLEDTGEEAEEATEEGFSFEPSENDEIEQTDTEVPEDTGEEAGEGLTIDQSSSADLDLFAPEVAVQSNESDDVSGDTLVDNDSEEDDTQEVSSEDSKSNNDDDDFEDRLEDIEKSIDFSKALDEKVTTDINGLFMTVNSNVKEASDIFLKNVEMKKKIDERFEELKKLQRAIEKSKKKDYDEINAYKDKVINELMDRKKEIENRLNELKENQRNFEKEKDEFESYKRDETLKLEDLQRESEATYDSHKEELEDLENKIRKQKNALDEERRQLSLDQIQYESDKNELANNMLKFNEIVGSFTNGMDKLGDNN